MAVIVVMVVPMPMPVSMIMTVIVVVVVMIMVVIVPVVMIVGLARGRADVALVVMVVPVIMSVVVIVPVVMIVIMLAGTTFDGEVQRVCGEISSQRAAKPAEYASSARRSIRRGVPERGFESDVALHDVLRRI